MKNAKILLAEDSEMLAETMRDFLEHRGHCVMIAKNGEEVLHHPSLDCVDLIIMDIEMPIMDGLTATRKLREGGCTIPIVACTGSQNPSIKELALAAGCSKYIEKPIDQKSFISLISDLEVRIRRDPPSPAHRL